jgi:DNA-binding NarL/FixJ family response regulator
LRKILVTDDHAIVRMGMQRLLTRLLPEVTVLEAVSRLSMLQMLREHPDLGLLLLDLGLPDGNGLRSVEEALAMRPELPVVVVSGIEDADLARRALDLGVIGYVPKSADPAVTENAMRLVLAGGSYIPPFALAPRSGVRLAGATFTARQQDIMRELCGGLSNKQVAQRLGLTEATVKGHLTTIFRLLRVNSRSQAILAVQQLQQLPPP